MRKMNIIELYQILKKLRKRGVSFRGKFLGVKEYHTAEIKTIEDARKIYSIVRGLAQ